MKTTVDIPDELLRSVMKLSGAKTIKAAVVEALSTYNRIQGQRSLVKHLGAFKEFMTQQDLRRMRGDSEEEIREQSGGQQRVDRSPSRARPGGNKVPRRKSA